MAPFHFPCRRVMRAILALLLATTATLAGAAVLEGLLASCPLLISCGACAAHPDEPLLPMAVKRNSTHRSPLPQLRVGGVSVSGISSGADFAVYPTAISGADFAVYPTAISFGACGGSLTVTVTGPTSNRVQRPDRWLGYLRGAGVASLIRAMLYSAHV